MIPRLTLDRRPEVSPPRRERPLGASAVLGEAARRGIRWSCRFIVARKYPSDRNSPKRRRQSASPRERMIWRPL